MKKTEALKWYSYYVYGIENCGNFESYYNLYQEQFNSMKVSDYPLAFGNCIATTPCVSYDKVHREIQQEEGNNPMYKTTLASVTPSHGALAISIDTASTKSDEMLQRQYLLDELKDQSRYDWSLPKLDAIQKMFNIGARLYPESSQELIDAFKNGKVTIDQAKVDKNTKYFTDTGSDYDDDDFSNVSRRFFGITFTDLPVEDRKGYDAAMTEYRNLIKKTERTINISSPADGLTALLALEAWMPTAPTIH